jgi:hypothetical protein
LADWERSFKRLVLAAQDMLEAGAAAEFLLARDDLSGDVLLTRGHGRNREASRRLAT